MSARSDRTAPATAIVHARGAALAAAVALVVLALLPVVTAVIMSVVGGVAWSDGLRLVITAVVYAPVAAVALTRRRPAVAAILGSLAITSGWLALTVVLAGLPGARPDIDTTVAIFNFVARPPEIAALAILPWLLVRGRGGIRAAGIGLGLAAVAAECVGWLIWFSGATPPPVLDLLPLAMAIASLGAAAIVLRGEWRSGTDRERQALSWFAFGVALLIASYVRVVVELPGAVAVVADAVFVLAQGVLPTAVLAVLIGGRELGADRFLADGIVWVQSLALAVSLYLIVDASATAVGLSQAVAGGFAAGALALSFSAMIRFVRRRTTMLYYGPGADAREVLGRLGERIAASDDPGAGLRGLAESLRATWQLASVTITPAVPADAVGVGVPGSANLRAELRAGGRPVGALELTGDDEAVLRHRVQPVLDDIAGLIAIAVLLAGVNQEVAATRRRTLGVRREERRMLHRELHDGLAPALAGIGFGMAAARRMIDAGDPAARGAVGELRDQIAGRTEDVRLLARTMLPAALDAGDLDGALFELAQRFGGDGIVVAVRSEGSDVLDGGVQIALYLAVAEAVSRLRREGGTRRVDVRLCVDDARVRVHLEADGGRPSHAVWRDLLEAIRRRAADVGGSVSGGVDARGRFLELVVPR